ncbi:MAG TPA: hypothetical protein VFW04_06560, partial [Gemmatimonadaceae bacterium]|nr:hypothetical protein [Gemmatimonadaceae bacterium]
LVELLVVLVLLSIMAGVVGLGVHSARFLPIVDAEHLAAIQARDSAIRFGHPVSIAIATDSQPSFVTALPDGRLAVDTRLNIDPLTGGRNASR